MRKTLIAAASGLALAAGSVTMPSTASADPVLVPALIAAGIGGLGLGAAAVSANRAETVVVPERRDYYGEPSATYAAPATLRTAPTVMQQAPCYWTRARVDGVLRRVEICN